MRYGDASVCPNPIATFSPISVCARLTSSGGTGAPPSVASRHDARFRPYMSGWSSIRMSMVGTLRVMVPSSVSKRCSISFKSN